MEKRVTCCGVDCGACPYYPADCGGCQAIAGKPFWLTYTREDVCGIYACCVAEKKLAHCGRCAQLPCAHYALGDPTKTPAQNAADLENQLAVLRALEREGI